MKNVFFNYYQLHNKSCQDTKRSDRYYIHSLTNIQKQQSSCSGNSLCTGIALLGSSPFINCTFTVMLRAEPWRLAKFRLWGFTYSRFLKNICSRAQTQRKKMHIRDSTTLELKDRNNTVKKHNINLRAIYFYIKNFCNWDV